MQQSVTDAMLIRLVKLFIHWTYTGVLPKSSELDQLTDPYEPDGQPFWLYINAYVFGDRFVSFDFQQAVHEALQSYIGYRLPWNDESIDVVEYAVAYNAPDSTIILQLVDDYCFSCRHADGEREWEHTRAFKSDSQKRLPTSFIVRVVRRLPELHHMCETGEIEEKERCYSEHTSEGDKKRCDCLHMRYDEKDDYGYYE